MPSKEILKRHFQGKPIPSHTEKHFTIHWRRENCITIWNIPKLSFLDAGTTPGGAGGEEQTHSKCCLVFRENSKSKLIHTCYHMSLENCSNLSSPLFYYISELDSSLLQVLCLFSIVFSILELSPSSKFIAFANNSSSHVSFLWKLKLFIVLILCLLQSLQNLYTQSVNLRLTQG